MTRSADGALVLASASPRRRELLQALGLPFEVQPAELDERLPEGLSPREAVASLAAQKAVAVLRRRPQALVLAADTLVDLDGRVLGKPDGAAAARQMLRRLRGRSHSVCTGVSLAAGNVERCQVVESSVLMRTYSETEIERSIHRGTPFDKAGAYAIQDEDLSPVERIDGCYCNVMGLPLWPVWAWLRQWRPEREPCCPDAVRSVCGACSLREAALGSGA